MPQLLKGVPSNVLSFGRSAIFCSPSFPCSNQHLTIVLHWTTQKPLLLISFILSLLPPCFNLLWHHSTINLVMLPSLASNTGWNTMRCRRDFFNLPPTLNKPFSLMYESRLYLPLLPLNDFLPLVLSSLRGYISSLKTCYWSHLITSCCAYSLNDTSRSVGDNALVLQSDGWCLIFEIRIFLFFSIQATIVSSSFLPSQRSKIPIFL